MLFVWKSNKGRLFTLKGIKDNLLKDIIYKACYKNDSEILSSRNKRFLNKKRINKLFEEAYSREIYPPHTLFIMHQQSLANIDSSYSYPRYQVSEDGKCIIF